MILTSKMFEDALKQINVAFAEVNERLEKLEKEIKVLKSKEETVGGKTKKGKSKG